MSERIEKLKNIVKEMEEFEIEISEVEASISEVKEAKKVYLELENKSVLELEALKEKLSEGTYTELFGSKFVTSKESSACSKGSINFRVVERVLNGENLFDIAKDIYVGKTDKKGKDRVIDGKADLDTVYLTGRHVMDFFKKCPDNGRVTVALSRKNGKIYAPVIELTEVGEKAFK